MFNWWKVVIFVICSFDKIKIIPATSDMCIDTFTLVKYFNDGGELYSNGSTVELCQNECLTRSNVNARDFCFGFYFSTWGSAESRCYLNVNKNTQIITARLAGISQYTRRTCLPFGKCHDKFKYISSSRGFGGIYNDAPTLEYCKIACLLNDTCLAFEIDRSLSNIQCYLHFSEYKLVKADRVDHYIRYQASCNKNYNVKCNDSFHTYINTNGRGGVLYRNGNTLELCKKECLKTTDNDPKYCHGFDFNTINKTKECYIYLNAINMNTRKDRYGVNQYVRYTCRPFRSCDDKFKSFPSTSSKGGIANDAPTFQYCKVACLQLDKCLAFDFNSRDTEIFKCFLHIKKYNRIYTITNNTTHYVKYSEICNFSVLTVESKLKNKPLRNKENITKNDDTDRYLINYSIWSILIIVFIILTCFIIKELFREIGSREYNEKVKSNEY